MNAEGDNLPSLPARAFRLLGVRVDDVTMEEAVAWVDAAIRASRRSQIATVNVEFVVAAQRNARFLHALNGADLCVPDSVGILWQARILGRTLRARVPGADLVLSLSRMAATRGYSLFLLGAAPGVAELAATQLETECRGLRIAGAFAGSPASSEEDYIVGMIQAAQPDMLFVAYGAPQQDLWIERNLARCGATVAMGVGGSLDYIARIVPRAPEALRNAGLEWLYRLARQPWRWRRMLALPYGIALAIRSRLRDGKARAIVR